MNYSNIDYDHNINNTQVNALYVDDKIEDHPTFRSVSIINSSRDAFRHPSLISVLVPPEGRNVSTKKPLLPIFPPSGDMQWVVTKLKNLNQDIPLERSSCFIHDVDSSIISSRICECLRIQSVHAKYDNVKAKAMCQSKDFVSFHINLFAESNDCVAVEIQRRNGASASFNRLCKTILSAAQGKSRRVPSVRPSLANLMCLRDVCNVPEDCSRFVEDEDAVTKSLQTVRDLFDRNTQRLALELLVSLTDPQQSSSKTAQLVSNIILTNPSDTHQSLLHLHNYIIRSEIETNKKEQTQSLGLSILSNIMSTALDHSTLHDVIYQKEDWFVKILFPSLMDHIGSAQSSPRCAYLASKCLTSLLKCSPVARNCAHDSCCIQNFELAKQVGSASYCCLEEEMNTILPLLKS